jgi:regulator of cell morphogenesis and NO signaling
MTPNSEQTVRDIAAANPAAARVFEQLGIDYCCGGKQTLSTACERAHVSLESVVQLLDQPVESTETPVRNDATLGELTRYIVDRHHAYVRRESPRVMELFTKVCRKHGPAHPELVALKVLFETMAGELDEHMWKEEHILFPYIQSLESGAGSTACFGSVENPIAQMMADHENAGAILEKIRSLSNGHTPPQGACPTFRALYAALAEFERDLHWHVHLENNILFPRAIAAVRQGKL